MVPSRLNATDLTTEQQRHMVDPPVCASLLKLRMQLTKHEGTILKKVQKYGDSGFIMASHVASCIKCIVKDSIETVPQRWASCQLFPGGISAGSPDCKT